MGRDHTYCNFTTDNRFSNPWQFIRGQSIRSPLYFSNGLYRVGRRYKFPQHRLTQQVYFPVQVPNRRVSTKSTHSWLSLWSRFGTTSFPNYIIIITHWGSLKKSLLENYENLTMSQWLEELKNGLQNQHNFRIILQHAEPRARPFCSLNIFSSIYSADTWLYQPCV